MRILLLFLGLTFTGCTLNSADSKYVLSLDDLAEGATVKLTIEVEVLSESADSVAMKPNNTITPELSVPLSLTGGL